MTTWVLERVTDGKVEYWVGNPEWRQQWTDRPYLARHFATAAEAYVVADTHAELRNSDKVRVRQPSELCERTS